MVDINFTLVVQLVLFLIFLWVTNKLVLRPMTQLMDQRQQTNRDNLEAAERDAEQAEKLESDYAAQMASARRESVVTIEKARREALAERMQAIADRKQSTEDQVAVARDEAMGQVDAARAGYGQLTPGLMADIAKRLNVGLGAQKGADS